MKKKYVELTVFVIFASIFLNILCFSYIVTDLDEMGLVSGVDVVKDEIESEGDLFGKSMRKS